MLNVVHCQHVYMYVGCWHMGLDAKKAIFGVSNNRNADQPAHPRRLVSVFVLRILEQIVYTLAKEEISTF